MKALCSFMFGSHSTCKEDIHNLNTMNTKLLTQIQELKAMNHFESYKLEKKITELEAQLVSRGDELDALAQENRSLKDEIEALSKQCTKPSKGKRTTCAASDGTTVEIVDYKQDEQHG